MEDEFQSLVEDTIQLPPSVSPEQIELAESPLALTPPPSLPVLAVPDVVELPYFSANFSQQEPSEDDGELWPPSPESLHLIETGTVPAHLLTKPKPSTTVAFVSPAVELMMKSHGEQGAARLQTTPPETSEENVRMFVKEGRLLSAVNMLTDLLNGREMSIETLQLWTLRFVLLMKLGKYSTVDAEMALFGNLDKCDMYHEFYPESKKKGSAVPWSMRLVWGLIPLHCPASGGLYRALDRLYGLVYHLDQVMHAGLPYLQEQRVVRYKSRVLVEIAGVLASAGSVQPAIKILKQVQTTQQELHIPITNAIIRLYFHVGNVTKGEQLLEEVENQLEEEEREVNEGFRCIAHGDYSEAYQHFSRAVNHNPNNTVAAINGAVCLLYMGRLGDSILQFEGAIKSSLHPTLVFNLVSLYELKTAASTTKKYQLLDLVTSKPGWEAFPFEFLRL
eukprot:sb/3479551/